MASLAERFLLLTTTGVAGLRGNHPSNGAVRHAPLHHPLSCSAAIGGALRRSLVEVSVAIDPPGCKALAKQNYRGAQQREPLLKPLRTVSSWSRGSGASAARRSGHGARLPDGMNRRCRGIESHG